MILPTKNKVTLPYGSTAYPYSKSKPHRGTDYSYYRLGTPRPSVVLPERAKCVRSGFLGDCGLSVDFQIGNRKYRFCHLDRTNCRYGEYYGMGTEIGRMGSTGFVFGAHLHFMMWLDGGIIDGDKYIRERLNMTYDQYKWVVRKIYGWPNKTYNWKAFDTKYRNWTQISFLAALAQIERNKLLETQKALEQAENKPPKEIIKEIEKIVEKEIPAQYTLRGSIDYIINYVKDKWNGRFTKKTDE